MSSGETVEKIPKQILGGDAEKNDFTESATINDLTIMKAMVAATEEVAEDVAEVMAGVMAWVIMADTVTVTAMAITAITEGLDMDGGAILMDGVILTGGIIGGTILTIPTPIPTPITIPIIMVVMGNRRLHKGSPLRHNWDNSNHLIGTSARTQRVTTPMLKIVRVVG